MMLSEADLMYVHSIIISYITYCLATWSQASITSLKPQKSLYKQSLKMIRNRFLIRNWITHIYI